MAKYLGIQRGGTRIVWYDRGTSKLQQVIVQNALFVPELKENLQSVRKLID
jgi:hypothetical protein